MSNSCTVVVARVAVHRMLQRSRPWHAVPLILFASWLAAMVPFASAGGGCLEIRNGYFWDPLTTNYFIPRGIAYQTWNPAVGANQSFAQLDYDLVEFRKIYANSVRCEMVWGEIETRDGVYNWEKPNHLIAEAEKLGLKLFVLIGFQYPPAWFPREWLAINNEGLTPEVLDCLAHSDSSHALSCLPSGAASCLRTNLSANALSNVVRCLPAAAQSGEISNVLHCLSTNVPADTLPAVLRCLISDVINYEHPQARDAYQKHIAAVTGHYKDSRAIAGWILGNEYAYFDLWEDPVIYPFHRFIGFDPVSQRSFRSHLATHYQTNISALNANWRRAYTNFESVIMPKVYPPDRNNPGYYDLIQWRKKSIGEFVALGAVAAKAADPNHLTTYSMVGGIFNGRDANYTCEDARTIVARCAATNAPLDFWSINNYANAAIGSELRSADFGIGKYQEESGLPVMISETGHSSTEDLFDNGTAGARQPKALPGQLWESLISGAIGTHLFHWSDRSQYVQGYFLRERGFGIVDQTRKIKVPVYWNVVEMFRRMQTVRIENLLGGSSNPPPDIQLFWSTNADMVWPRANQENTMMWGALKRLGYQPGIIDDQAFERGAYTNAPGLLLSRCLQLKPEHLDQIANRVIPDGIHVHADADLPGQFDAYHNPNPYWVPQMDAIFGLDVRTAVAGLDAIVTNDFYGDVYFVGADTLAPLVPGYSAYLQTWKIWHGLRVTSGKTIVTDTGYTNSQPPLPALVIKTNSPGRGKSAITTFALGDTFLPPNLAHTPLWDIRYDWLRAIYRTHFGIRPIIELTGPGAKYVIPDYRLCRNGSILLSLLNENTADAFVTVNAPRLLAGKTVENLTAGGILQTNPEGSVSLAVSADDYVLLYAYASDDQQDQSLANASPYKIWFASAPMAVWPRGSGYDVAVAYDTRGAKLELFVSFELVGAQNKTYGRSTNLVTVNGKGTNVVQVPIPDADLNDPTYISSREGGNYVLHAWLEKTGTRVSEIFLPVRLLWGVRPVTPLPSPVVPGQTYSIPLEWQELPSYEDPTPLDRAILWDSLEANAQHYNIVLELRDSAGRVVASNPFVTSAGSGTNPFSITAPPGAQGPFSWSASVQSAPKSGTLDLNDSFEGRERGLDRSPIYPWYGYVYPPYSSVVKLSEGVVEEWVGGPKAGFLVVTNPPNSGGVPGFGIIQGSTNEWALPANAKLWSNYVFSADFKETHSYKCVVELQVKDVNENWLEFTNSYAPGPNPWVTIRGSLNQFVLPSRPGATFDSTRIKFFAVNIRMLQTNVTYEGRFDNIRFIGPPNLQDGFEDRQAGIDFSRIAPWTAYGYDQANHNDVLLDKGVHLQASDGSQSAFVVAWNRTNSGDFAGFGMIHTFGQEWSLPVDTNAVRNYSFSFDFKERDGKACMLELQLKNKDETNTAGLVIQRAINFTKLYTPREDGWDTIQASLDQFIQPDYFGLFNPGKVAALVANIQMLEKNPQENVIYVGSIDNIRFNGPDIIAPGETTYSIYTATNDFVGFKSIIRSLSGELILSWVGAGTLQMADEVGGPWTDVRNATSPYALTPAASQRFYRLRR